MKKTYAYLMSGAMLVSLSLTSCSSEDTTGVDTETNTTESEGMNNSSGGGMTEEGGTSAGTGTNAATGNSGTGSDTASTTTPPADNDM